MKNDNYLDKIYLTEPMVRMLAFAYRNQKDVIWGEFMDTYMDGIDDEGSLSWYDDEYNSFFTEICDLDESLPKLKKKEYEYNF
tara:strand:- start:3965 stop:4213 length:249 start_codon:yes stop_codon:yes gene_type:complete